MISVSERKGLIRAALGDEALDLLITNVQVVNVHTGLVEQGAIGLKSGCIVTTSAPDDSKAKEVVDGKGRYAIPGFIDTHVHLDSTLVTPENLSSLIVPHGTTTMLADPMEIANVAGKPGFEALLQSQDRLPYHIFIEVSSRVPTAPGLETTGGELKLADVKEILEWEAAVSLGELDPSKVLGLMDEYLAKIEAAQTLGKICNGHAVGRVGKELTAYVCGGLADDHECCDYEEALSRLRLGLSVLIREGSTERNLAPILRGVVENNFYTPFLMFCTDDKHPDDIMEEGHIDYMVNRAIELGVPPVTAIQMATLNAARHFRIDHLVGSLSPGRWADIIFSEDIQTITPVEVYVKGRLVARDGDLAIPVPVSEYPAWLYWTVKVTKGEQPQDYVLEAEGPTTNVKVIELYSDQIVNKWGQATLSVIDGQVKPDVANDVLKLVVVERYGKNGNIGKTFVRGFGLKKGAIASSVSHDHHNIIMAGTNDEDLAVCARTVQELQGGLVIASEGKVLGKMALPIGGLLSELPVTEVIEKLNEINSIYHSLGGILPAPFMTLSFIGLPTVPELGLTDKGLVDVLNYELVSPFD